MHRHDIYIITIAATVIMAFLRVITLINLGAGMVMMGKPGAFGIIAIVLFATTFILIFQVLATLVRALGSTDVSGEGVMLVVARAARMTLAVLILYAALEFLWSLSFLSS